MPSSSTSATNPTRVPLLNRRARVRADTKQVIKKGRVIKKNHPRLYSIIKSAIIVLIRAEAEKYVELLEHSHSMPNKKVRRRLIVPVGGEGNYLNYKMAFTFEYSISGIFIANAEFVCCPDPDPDPDVINNSSFLELVINNDDSKDHHYHAPIFIIGRKRAMGNTGSFSRGNENHVLERNEIGCFSEINCGICLKKSIVEASTKERKHHRISLAAARSSPEREVGRITEMKLHSKVKRSLHHLISRLTVTASYFLLAAPSKPKERIIGFNEKNNIRGYSGSIHKSNGPYIILLIKTYKPLSRMRESILDITKSINLWEFERSHVRGDSCG